jgi:hypothetical protein
LAIPEAKRAFNLEPDPSKKTRYEKMVAGMEASIGRPKSPGVLRKTDPDDDTDANDEIPELERRLASAKDKQEKTSWALMLAINHFNEGHREQAKRYALIVLDSDPGQVTAKSILDKLKEQSEP